MNFDDKQNKKYLAVLITSLITIGVIVIIMCISFVAIIKKSVKEETDRSLREISQHVSSRINYRIQSTFETLESTAKIYVKLDNKKGVITSLKSIAKQYDYTRIGIVGKDGIAYTTDDFVTDMSEEIYVQKALQGENTVSDVESKALSRGNGITYAVPIEENGNITGALIAVTSKEKMSDFFNIESFGGEGYSHIINLNGDFVIRSNNKNATTSYDNFFTMMSQNGIIDNGYSIAKMRYDMKNNDTGMLYYTLKENNIRKALIYIPLEIEGWYVLSVVPLEAATAQSELFIQVSIILNCIICFLFIILLFLMVYLQRKNHSHLKQIAFVDPVTGGCNRIWFEKEAKRLIESEPAKTYAMVSMDIQKFKLINDSFGSHEGDKLLKYVYTTIYTHLHTGELAARVSADTFYLLIKNTQQNEMIKRLDAMVEKINSFNSKLKQKYFIPFCEGIYIIDEPHLTTITIQDRATVARKNMKYSHTRTLNTCVFYSDLERVKLIREKEIYNRMEAALENKEFIVYLQPKVELERNSIAGAEALVRWKDPQKGIISPNDFIPVFEKNGFITKLDIFVFEEVCELLKNWIDHEINPVPISVNLSRVHLANPQFLENFKVILKKYQIPASLVEIELTETLVFENLEALVHVIDDIHEAGLRCSLDDFGSGYSSLNMLKDVPADVLKLDRAFFYSRQKDDSRGKYVVESVIELAKKLNMKTVSEGIETIPQVKFLKEAKCDMVQGYVFSKPLPIKEFEKLLLKKNIYVKTEVS